MTQRDARTEERRRRARLSRFKGGRRAGTGRQVRRQRKSRAGNVGHGSSAVVGGGQEREGGTDETGTDRETERQRDRTTGPVFEGDASTQFRSPDVKGAI